MAYGLTKSANLVSASTQYFSRANAAALNPTGSMSIEGWYNFSTLNSNNALASKGNIGILAGPWAFRWTNDNVLHLYISDGSTTSDSTVSWTPSTGSWYHVAATHDTSGNVKFYINGVQQGTTQTGARTAINGSDTGSFIIAGYSTTNGNTANSSTLLDANVSLVRFWSSVRTVSEISTNMCVVFGTAQTNMIGEWSLDNVVTDASGNGFTLTNNGTATFTSTVPSVCTVAPFIASQNKSILQAVNRSNTY